jgi:hypothetical protein
MSKLTNSVEFLATALGSLVGMELWNIMEWSIKIERDMK